MSVATSQQAAMDGAVRHLVGNYSPKGKRVGWLMMASILVEAWDLYSIAFSSSSSASNTILILCCWAWLPPGPRAER